MAKETYEQRVERLKEIYRMYHPDSEKDYQFFDSEGEPFYKDTEIMTIHFFWDLAVFWATGEVEKLIYGKKINFNEKPFMGAGSRLTYHGYIWELAFLLAAKHGFYYDLEDEVYDQVYSQLFSWVFSEYDDFRRDRISRKWLFEELVRWDVRFREDTKRRINQAVSEEERQFWKELLEEATEYTFIGDDKLGIWMPRFGYLSPHSEKPLWNECEFPSDFPSGESENSLSDYRRHLNSVFAGEVGRMIVYLFRAGIVDPEKNGFEFITFDRESKTIKVSDKIKEATDEQVYSEYSKVCKLINHPELSPDKIKDFVIIGSAIPNPAPIKVFQEVEKQLN